MPARNFLLRQKLLYFLAHLDSLCGQIAGGVVPESKKVPSQLSILAAMQVSGNAILYECTADLAVIHISCVHGVLSSTHGGSYAQLSTVLYHQKLYLLHTSDPSKRAKDKSSGAHPHHFDDWHGMAGSVLYCNVLCCTVLLCIVLYCTALHCTALYCTVLHVISALGSATAWQHYFL